MLKIERWVYDLNDVAQLINEVNTYITETVESYNNYEQENEDLREICDELKNENQYYKHRVSELQRENEVLKARNSTLKAYAEIID